MAALDEISAAVAKAAQSGGPSVVGIGGHWRRGSGVVIGGGRVLTNAHNIRGDETTVVFSDGRQAKGTILGFDVDGDLAVLDVDTGGAPALAWPASKGAPAIGSVVFAVTSAYSGSVRATVGLISGVDRSFRGPGGRAIGGSIEHTAPMAPGSSGSPILDAEGRLLGINTQREGEGFYLAIRADDALKARVDLLSRGESPSRPRLGVAVAPGQVARHMRRAVGLPDRAGVLIRGIEDGSPAEKAGLREGDLLVSAGGAAIEDADGLHEALSKAGAGKLEIGLVRGVEEIKVTVDLGGGASSPGGGAGAGGSAPKGKAN